ncbi:uncharacterized protein SPAPADRAFT_48511 [Spathaspora passalidarum NRRL Y-27907]|uniref:Uncharacterized protein n=1 Tax=Spathaspora passalidarum (strain NRRL Y-27907 / 11-Y1) TaxID=619300 RepID=G3AH95_SPAPN|nr:uncharacterized protein SPAPADRAFT_48511 [Spathaspora passalidarum NRRL Y-27907]EGW35525.1 hypothetical protein SPAPADRAFT_48511 [Spathaspora passalidarum NRRL Y-27907]
MAFMSQPITSSLTTTTSTLRLPVLSSCSRSFSPSSATFTYLPVSIKLQDPSTLELSDYQIIFDVRPFKQYSKSRIHTLVDLCIPTTLLKRKSLDLIEILKNFVNVPKDIKDLILAKLIEEAPSTKIKVLIYDSNSKGDSVSYSLYQTCLRFESYADKFEVFMLNGGIQNVNSDLIEENKINTNIHNLNGLVLPSPDKTSFNSIIKKETNISSRYHHQNLSLPKLSQHPNWLKFVVHKDHPTLLQHFIDLFIKIETLERNRLTRLTSPDFIASSPPCCSPCRNISFTLPRGIEYGYKNRYNNIWPYEHSRVKLDSKGDDYFNGNYIDVNPIIHNQFKYIATQNPLASTVDDFWTTVLQQEVDLIINLENKPSNYFNHPAITSCETIESNSSYTVTKINNKIFHLHYSNWPDFGIPNFNTLIEFIELKNDLFDKHGLSNKVLVHCSAGCGRTGVFITIDSLIQGWLNNRTAIISEESDLIFRLIMHERRQRISMVQNLDQFIVCYQLFLHYLSQQQS